MESTINKIWVIWVVTASHLGAGFFQIAFGQNCTGTIQMFNNQLNVTVDLLNSRILISGFDCDPCVTGISFEECRAIQSCYQDCEYLIPPQPDYGDIIENCLVSCQGEPDPYVYYDCVGYCQELPLEAYNNCLVQNGCPHLNRVRGRSCDLSPHKPSSL
jgi:hypothetical protein